MGITTANSTPAVAWMALGIMLVHILQSSPLHNYHYPPNDIPSLSTTTNNNNNNNNPASQHQSLVQNLHSILTQQPKSSSPLSPLPLPPPRQPQNQNRFAIITSAVSTTDHYKRSSFHSLLLCLKRSLTKQNSTLPFHLIYGGGFNETQLTSLTSHNIIIHDFTSLAPIFKHQIYKPLYSAHQAYSQSRFYNPNVQHRKDGWATYFKFLTWTFEEYQRVLYVDADVILQEDPMSMFTMKQFENVTFQAFRESAKRPYEGLNTHMMMVKPDVRVFRKIVERAKMGLYVPYTNTEQDVLEWMFPPELFTKLFDTGRDNRGLAVKHLHGAKHCY